MTLVTPGILTTNTAESLLLEAALLMQILESRSEYNTFESSKVNVVIDTDEKTVTITANLGITFLAQPVGTQTGIAIIANEYLATPGGTPLTGIPTSS